VEDRAGHEQAIAAVSPDSAGRRLDLPPLPPALEQMFDVIRPLGMGGMGAVWLVRDAFLDRPVALKVLLDGSSSADRRERFLREARTSARLEHPHIIDVFRADDTDGTVWFTMRFVDGESLGDRIRERETLPVLELLNTLREVAWGLAYAHARGVVHRDIKPDNILLDRDSGRAVLTDFGIARDTGTSDSNLTIDGHVLGSVQYMSPEQASGDTVDGRTDIYAVGCVAFQALSGRLLFEGPPQSILVAHVTRPAPRLTDLAPNVPAAVADLIDRCLQKDPADRYQTADALAAALEAAMREVRQAEREIEDASPGALVSEEEAQKIWQRAAQLQAEAAHRLERNSRLTASAERKEELKESGGYRMREVEQAAEEAGISRQYVALALAERQSLPTQKGAGVVVSERMDRQFTTMHGTTDRSISVSRVIPASPKETLGAIGEVFTAQPYTFTVRDTLNGHPLDGGILRFTVPRLTTSSMLPMASNRQLLYRLEQIELFDLNVTLHARRRGAQASCEVVITGDLRSGLRRNLIADWAFIGGGALLGGAGGAAAGAAILGASALVALPVAGTALLAGGATRMWYRWLFRQALEKAQEELGALLAATETHLMKRDLFK
jgi:eukaryotic-like serine/threonine-protein kinase